MLTPGLCSFYEIYFGLLITRKWTVVEMFVVAVGIFYFAFVASYCLGYTNWLASLSRALHAWFQEVESAWQRKLLPQTSGPSVWSSRCYPQLRHSRSSAPYPFLAAAFIFEAAVTETHTFQRFKERYTPRLWSRHQSPTIKSNLILRSLTGCLYSSALTHTMQNVEMGVVASNYGGLNARPADELGWTFCSLLLCSAYKCALFIFLVFVPPLCLRERLNVQGGFHRGLLISALH